MSKRNIRPNSGKQLYLNQIFYKGMLYTSSEMQEGFAKVIDNYDIAPTGDAASPRHPLKLINDSSIGSSNEYVVPVKFKQDNNKQSYVKFYRTISEEDFVNNSSIKILDYKPMDIGIIKRSDNAINTEVSFENEISYVVPEQYIDDDTSTELVESYKNKVNTSENISVYGGKCIYKQYYFNGVDLTYKDIEIYSLPTVGDYPTYTAPPTIIDGDTIDDLDDVRHRLFGIDCRELGTEWSLYAKQVLYNIFNSPNCVGWNYNTRTTDAYGRKVSSIVVFYKDLVGDILYVIDVADILLKTGLAVMRYIDRDTDVTSFESYLRLTQYAMENELKIFNKGSDFDPFYNTITPTLDTSSGNNLQITENMYIEAVCIKDGFHISAVSQTAVDFVHTVYVSYLDSLAFIGRIIDYTTNDIVYKGPILLRAQKDMNDNNIHTILLPSNQGEGVTPSIVEAANTNGYNLINNNMINLENKKEEYSAMSILGTTVVYKDYDLGIDKDNPQIVTQGVVGQEVYLKAIINEKGFYNYDENTSTDNYGFNIVIGPISVDGKQLFPERTISRSENELSNITSDTYGLADAITSVLKDMTDEEKETYPLDKDSNWEDVLDNTTIEIKSITLYKGENTIRIPSNEYVSLLTTNTQPLWEGSVLELRSELKIDGDSLIINFHNNFSTINQTFTSDNNLIIRGSTFPLEFYSKWEVSDYGGEHFRDISSEKLIFIKESNSSILNLVGDWYDDIVKPTDTSYILSGMSNLMFRFSIQPKILNKLSYTCPESLQNIYLINSYQNMSMVTPVLKIGAGIETISDKDLRTNMDIKNATRIGIFNRQLCVYGPYTLSNSLFFSKFEKFDYFPFPSGVIELEEPITWVYNYKDAFIIFGKNHIHMLKGAISVTECTLHKIYENLSVHLPDVRVINTVGNNLIFFNNGVGYVIVPNTYVDSQSNIKVYKLTEYISNFFYNPEEYIRNRIPDINIDSHLIYKMELSSYVQNNNIIITDNITITESGKEYTVVVWFIYNQDYKYWRMYSTTLFDRIVANYVCEPNVNYQFVVSKDNTTCMAFFTNVYTLDYKDIDTKNNSIPIITMLNSGYLSVDTMNDKRFKDLIIELDNINPEAKLYLNCEFFVDGSPMLLSDADALIIDKVSGAILESEKVLSEYKTFEAHHIGYPKDDTVSRSQNFGTTFKIDNKVYSMTGRTHIRIPVYGKGRLPAFTLKIKADKFYEFINYALIYKEKNINRRA